MPPVIPVDPPPLPGQFPSASGGWVALDAEGGLSPLRGSLPPAAGRFPAPPAATKRSRVPTGAFVTVTRLGPRRPPNARADAAPSGSAAIVPLAPRRLERRHKLMLALAAMVLALGASNARRTWRPPAVLVEEPARSGHALATAPGVAAPQNPLL